MSPTLLAIGAACASAGAVYFGGPLALAALDRVSRRHVADLRARMEQLGMEGGRLEAYLRCWWVAMAGALLLFWLGLGMLPVGAVAAALLFCAARPFLAYLAEAQRARVRDQMVLAARLLANQVRAGQSLALGLEAVSEATQPPLGQHLRRVVLQYQQGWPLAATLTSLKDRLRSDAVTLFVVAALTCHERGGNLAQALERIGHALEELQRVERKQEGNTASGRMLILVLALFPGAFLALFALLDPEGTRAVFVTRAGQLVLCAVAVIVYASVRWGQWVLGAQE